MSDLTSVRITPPSGGERLFKRKIDQVQQFKKEHPITCVLLVSVFLLAGQMYLFPHIGLAAPTNLNKFPKKTRKSICARICNQGYDLCSGWYNIYRGRSTPARFLACGIKSCIYPVGWITAGGGYIFGGRDSASFIIGVTASIGKGIDEFIGHTTRSDEAACGCPNKEKSWFSSFIDWLFADRNGSLRDEL